MWLPDGWWIITEISTSGVRFTASANGLPEIDSSSKFRSELEATRVARFKVNGLRESEFRLVEISLSCSASRTAESLLRGPNRK
jgi:hypothetical protein